MIRGSSRGRVVAPHDVLLLAAITGLPWWFGGVGLDAFRVAAALIGLAAGWALARRGPSGLGLDRRALWLAPAFALGGWAFLQAAPLPRSLVTAVSPKAAAIQAEAFGPGAADADAWLRQLEVSARAKVPEAANAPLVGEPLSVGRDAAAPPRWFRLSLAPDATLERAFWYAALVLAFLLVAVRTSDPRRADIYRRAMFSFFVALAGVGLLNHLSAPSSILWLVQAPEATRPMGPYVNPSHFAGVMELAVPWMLGCGLAPLARRRSDQTLTVTHVLLLAGGFTGLVATVVAASKTATATIVATSLILVLMAARRSRHGWRIIAGALSAVLLLGVVAFAGPLRGRVADFVSVYRGEVTDTDRTLMWNVGAALVRDFPVTGIGFGAFPQVVPAYLPPGEPEHWMQMHNDYLEVLAAGGVVAALLVIALAVAYAARLSRAVRLASSTGRLLPALGLALGLGALAVHEVVDFNLQIPANSLLFVATAALALAPVTRSDTSS